MAEETKTLMIRTNKDGSPNQDKEGNDVIVEMDKTQVDNLRKMKGHCGWTEKVDPSAPKDTRTVAQLKELAKELNEREDTTDENRISLNLSKQDLKDAIEERQAEIEN